VAWGWGLLVAKALNGGRFLRGNLRVETGLGMAVKAVVRALVKAPLVKAAVNLLLKVRTVDDDCGLDVGDVSSGS